ncbi:MAG: hypothetical protein KAT74_06460, partial [Candidatus Cloacimonetes bacterium]|nr:hypothetical protein [Candidatus Cloacimonadota bacterium]
MNTKDLKSKSSFKTKKKAQIDLIIIVSAVLISFLLASIFNAFEIIFKVSQRFPAFFIGEFLIALVVLSIGLI